MGKSAPPPAPFNLVNSYARSRGGTVEIVLTGPEGPAAQVVTEAVLRKGGKRVLGGVRRDEGPCGPRLVVTVDRDRLTDGTWVVRLRAAAEQPVATRTRLLVQGARPLVLLWGNTDPDSRLPVPHPRTAASGPAGVRGTVVRAGSRTLDTVLSPLPEERRRSARQQARRAARKLLG